jgi:hypothetical protein
MNGERNVLIEAACLRYILTLGQTEKDPGQSL